MSEQTPNQRPLITQDEINLEMLAEDLSTDSEDGGMYLDLADPEAAIYYRTEDDPEFGPQQIIRDDRDENRFSARAPQPSSYSQQQNQISQAIPQGHIEKDIVSDTTYRSYVETEEEHAALTVLNDPELLTMYACKSNLSIPQTRRRFTAKWISKGDRSLEKDLISSSFTIPLDKAHLVPDITEENIRSGYIQQAVGWNGNPAYLVPGEWKMKVDHDMSGWWHPGHPKSRDPRGYKHGGSGSRSGSESGSGNGRRKSARRGYEVGVQFGDLIS
ncbi:hypothetical protein N7478_008463 [Penicillium angulare]|uniref:uncharacterized protein n=1 Tax=Penicillium angulare TaxID=116970 RepID=UPI002540DB54|nr:uncharacterized protein N7478_008463 [Penicillium angulare]KAJ5273338.1 hypothetical protein N7478_008463 [Penicillium angulare]